MTDLELCNEAINAMKYSYSPYSEYSVGAALLTKNGNMYSGCNIENASFSPTICAERVAFFKAISNGEKEFVKIAVAGGKKGTIAGAFPPCGVCRQVMNEFCDSNFEILLVDGNKSYKTFNLNTLLPFSFGAKIIED